MERDLEDVALPELRYLEKTIRSAVEQHLFDAHGSGGQSSEDSESGTSSASSNVSTRQRRRHHKEQEEGRRNRDVEVINKENIPSGFGNLEDCILTPQEVEKLQENNSGYIGERNKPKRQKSSTKLSELNDNQDSPVAGCLIRQLLDEDSDPMLSPRFYAYGQSQQYLDDTEVPPSPPNSHSFMRRRSSSLGSCEDDREDLTPAQLTRRIQGLKKKIRKFEDRFEEERKYRPSHSDKAANPEVLKWTNELAKFRKQLKESKLKKWEEDLAPVVRQRSNTLPKSFGSQLEKEDDKQQDLSDKSAKPAVEVTLDSIQKKLQEKRAETNRPEDIKDMTRDEIAAEKVALQKALLYYESIHGRPVTKNERQVMKPLYDRYRLVKQILSRANTIPVIGSPSSKRRSPLLQPIIEGETASFFKEIKEEEEGSDEDSSVKPDFTVTLKPDFSVRSFLDQLEDEADGFISPVDDKMPSKSSQDLGLSTLHAASINVQKEDRTPMAEEYNEYKQIKAKLRLLEVLISKRDISSKIM
ncbi:Protein FAM13A [Chelonia mydas]|uniref:Protein FAM13A n=1 Tax=Chelonia mydas TaxID=8469 RepID=M7AX73_CHEMY|nr:Protein FAM13A [Chelonia mydas]